MTFQTHPREQRDANDNIIPFDYKHIHLVEARSKACKLTPIQLAAELRVLAHLQAQGTVTTRTWHIAIAEEAATRFEAVNGTP